MCAAREMLVLGHLARWRARCAGNRGIHVSCVDAGGVLPYGDEQPLGVHQGVAGFDEVASQQPDTRLRATDGGLGRVQGRSEFRLRHTGADPKPAQFRPEPVNGREPGRQSLKSGRHHRLP
jgi:hypothetical protein